MVCSLHSSEGVFKSLLNILYTSDSRQIILHNSHGEGGQSGTSTHKSILTEPIIHDPGSGFKPRLSSYFISSEALGHRGLRSERAWGPLSGLRWFQHPTRYPLERTQHLSCLRIYRSPDWKLCKGRTHTEMYSQHPESTHKLQKEQFRFWAGRSYSWDPQQHIITEQGKDIQQPGAPFSRCLH